jgi:alpha-L-rhamnosidase
MNIRSMAVCDDATRRNRNHRPTAVPYLSVCLSAVLLSATVGLAASVPEATHVNWQAKWVAADRTDKDPLPIFRKQVRFSEPVRQAIIHICGLGHYELTINGRRVGDHEMDPGWTNYRKTCLYSSYDVTKMLETGENVIGVMLGNGMYNVPGGRYTKFKGTFGPPKLICQMHVIFADGSTQVVVSDETWKYALGPIVFTCIYGGEDYDARREQAGWDRPGFDDSAWSAARICEGPGGKLVAQCAPPVKVAEYLPAVAIQRLEEGEYEVDCGTNLSARPVIKVKGTAGSQVVIKVAERRGEPWTHNGGHVYNYTLKGKGDEVFRPRFTYFSFQYLYVSGVDLPGDAGSGGQRPLLLQAGSEFLTSSAAAVGGFECSNPLLNDINAMIDRSVRSNLQSVLTDCPHREKLGWLEVAHLMGPSILYHRNAQGLYRKICRDTSEAQLDSGLVPDIAPEYTRFQGAFFESPEWGSACVQLPNLLYVWYGDRVTEEQQYETMQRYTRYLASTRNDHGLVKPGLGDWYDWTPEKGHVGASQLTPAELPATAFLYDNACIVARVAERMGKKADVAEFDALARQVRQDFIKAYYKPAEHSVATGSQASLATALYFGLVPEEDRDKVLAGLVAEVERAQYRQSTGEVCFRMLVQALAQGGRSDVVYRMINRTDAPGYGHMLQLGFKTLSERWDKPGSSMNHCMFGHIQEWFQGSIIGIRQAPDSAGFERLILRPEPVGDLTGASGHYDSVRGRIESRWRIENGQFLWRVSVPPNTSAELHVPATDAGKVTEGGRPVDQTRGIVFVRMEPAGGKESGGRAIFKVGSGQYSFTSSI